MVRSRLAQTTSPRSPRVQDSRTARKAKPNWTLAGRSDGQRPQEVRRASPMRGYESLRRRLESRQSKEKTCARQTRRAGDGSGSPQRTGVEGPLSDATALIGSIHIKADEGGSRPAPPFADPARQSLPPTQPLLRSTRTSSKYEGETEARPGPRDSIRHEAPRCVRSRIGRGLGVQGRLSLAARQHAAGPRTCRFPSR